jgi:hypothetical protein
MRSLQSSTALLLMLCSPASLRADWQEKATGIAVPVARSLAINGPRLGDADYDPSHPKRGRLYLTGRDGWLLCRAVYQSTALDDKGSTFSVLTLVLESRTDSKEKANRSFTPRFSAGVSYAAMDIEVLDDDDADHVLWIGQLSGGFGVELTQEFTLDIRYRYLVPFDTMMTLSARPFSADVDRNNFLVGLRARF